jgi:hypothetical protein
MDLSTADMDLIRGPTFKELPLAIKAATVNAPINKNIIASINIFVNLSNALNISDEFILGQIKANRPNVIMLLAITHSCSLPSK